MKKVFFAIVTVAALSSCGTPSSESTEVTTDSTAVVVDSTKADSLTVDTATTAVAPTGK